MIHISFSPIKDCTNPDTYGEICVKCNDCGRFNVKCCVCEEILKPGDDVIHIEFYDVFCDFACPEHEDFIKEHCKTDYDGKYEFYGYKRDFLKNIK